MIPFDGEFAQDTVLPLANTAYEPTWNQSGNAILAKFTDVTEILVDTQDEDFQRVSSSKKVSDNSVKALTAMRRPKGAGTPPTAVEVMHAEGPPTVAADADVPPAGPDVAGATAAPTAPAVPVNDRFGWVCRDGARLIITLRGTQTPEDWLHNLDFIAEPYQPVPGRGTVHQGFQLVYYAIRKNLVDIVNKVGQGCTEVLITGHSLGGSLATLAMPDMLSNCLTGNVSPILYSLASPRTGHDDFQSFFDSHVNVCYRVVNTWDVVPHVPPVLAGFTHVGNQVTIDSGFSLDVVKNHVLSTGYAPGLAKWNEDHPIRQTAKLGRFAVSSLIGATA